jgi:hypothetical protein
MKSTRGYLVTLQLNRVVQSDDRDAPVSRTLGDGLHDFNRQCLRVLRCTAKALATGPGGLRFKAGTRPWLEGLSVARPVWATRSGRQLEAALLTGSD